MVEIRVPLERLREVAQSLQSYQQEVDELLQQSLSVVDNLYGEWYGVAQIDYVQILNDELPPLQHRFDEVLEFLTTELRRIADVFEEVDEQVITSSRGTSVGGAEKTEPSENSNDRNFQKPPQNMQDLAEMVDNLPPNEPIRIIKTADNEYLVLLRGTTDGEDYGHNWGSALQAGLGMPTPYEDAVYNLIKKHVPEGANLHFAGHSQGGIIANNIADNQNLLKHYAVETVTTFGAPKSTHENPNVHYTRYAALGDIVPMLNKSAVAALPFGLLPTAIYGGFLSLEQTQVDTKSYFSIEGSHSSYKEEQNNPLIGISLPEGMDTSGWEVRWNNAEDAEEGKHAVVCNVDADYGLSYAYNKLIYSDNLGEKAISLIDTRWELEKTLLLGVTDNVIIDPIETISGTLSPDLRNTIDHYTDNFYNAIVESPPPSKIPAMVIDYSSDVLNGVAHVGGQALAGLASLL